MCGKTSPILGFEPINTTVRSARHPDDAPPSPPTVVGFDPSTAPADPARHHARRDASPKVRAALDGVEDVLLGFDRDAQDLWAILTALRGPDEDPTRLVKEAQTVPVRRAAFPRLAQTGRANGRLADFGDGLYRALPRVHYPDSHFDGHINDAVIALTTRAIE